MNGRLIAAAALYSAGAKTYLLEGAFACRLDVFSCLFLCFVFRFFGKTQLPQLRGLLQSKPRRIVKLLPHVTLTLLNFSVALFRFRSGRGHYNEIPFVALARV